MTDHTAPSHLRLIKTQEEQSNKSSQPSVKREKQLAFPYPETATVFLVLVPTLRSEDFARMLGDSTPRWIIDVRAVPRLDILATSRMSAFALFERMKANYVDLFGRLGIRSYRAAESNPAFWSGALVDILRKSEKKGPYFFLFDDERLIQSADEILPDAIKSIVGKGAHFARIG